MSENSARGADDAPPRCIHEVLNEAAKFTRVEGPEDMPRLDVISTAIRATAPMLHVSIDDPQILEGIAAGVHITAIRCAAYFEAGVLSEGEYDAAMTVTGELIQALGLMYVAPPTPSVADLEALLPAQRAAVVE